MNRFSLVVVPVTVVALLGVAGGALAGKTPPTPTPDPALFPDLRTVVPQHLNLVNEGQNEFLRFSNGIANTGPGPWALRAEHDLTGTLTTTAYQEIRTSNDPYQCGTQPKQVTECYEIQSERAASEFEYHPTHNHWHTADAARFEVRIGSPTGPIANSQSTKVGFCLIEIYRLDGNSPTSARTFWDCHGTHQGIGERLGRPVPPGHRRPAGGAHRPAEPQGLLPGVDERPDQRLPRDERHQQQRLGALRASSPSNGNRKVAVTGHWSCDSPGLCGEGARTRAEHRAAGR